MHDQPSPTYEAAFLRPATLPETYWRRLGETWAKLTRESAGLAWAPGMLDMGTTTEKQGQSLQIGPRRVLQVAHGRAKLVDEAGFELGSRPVDSLGLPDFRDPATLGVLAHQASEILHRCLPWDSTKVLAMCGPTAVVYTADYSPPSWRWALCARVWDDDRSFKLQRPHEYDIPPFLTQAEAWLVFPDLVKDLTRY